MREFINLDSLYKVKLIYKKYLLLDYTTKCIIVKVLYFDSIGFSIF